MLMTYDNVTFIYRQTAICLILDDRMLVLNGSPF